MRRGFFDGSAEGRAKGFADGRNGSPRKAVVNLAELAAHAIRPKSYTETYLKGYAAGYREGAKEAAAKREAAKKAAAERAAMAEKRAQGGRRVLPAKTEPGRER